MTPSPPSSTDVETHTDMGAASDPPGDQGDVLTVRNVCAGYGPYRALFNVNFRVPSGGIVALVGSNGAGKSTVARTVTGLVTATSGEVFGSADAGARSCSSPATRAEPMRIASMNDWASWRAMRE